MEHENVIKMSAYITHALDGSQRTDFDEIQHESDFHLFIYLIR
jgi:hypothetical protein